MKMEWAIDDQQLKQRLTDTNVCYIQQRPAPVRFSPE